MRHIVKKLALPLADNAGGVALNVMELREAAFQVHGTGFTVSMKLQGKISEPTGDSQAHDDWFDITGGGFTTTGLYLAVPQGVTHVRLFRTTAATPADLAVHVGGKYSRSE